MTFPCYSQTITMVLPQSFESTCLHLISSTYGTFSTIDLAPTIRLSGSVLSVDVPAPFDLMQEVKHGVQAQGKQTPRNQIHSLNLSQFHFSAFPIALSPARQACRCFNTFLASLLAALKSPLQIRICQ